MLIGDASRNQRQQCLQSEQDIGASKVERARVKHSFDLQPTFPTATSQAAIILAAGKSTRMGEAKQLLPPGREHGAWRRPSRTFAARRWMRSFWFSALLRKPSAGSFRRLCSKESRLWSTRLTSREWRVRCEPGSPLSIRKSMPPSSFWRTSHSFVPETLDQLAVSTAAPGADCDSRRTRASAATRSCSTALCFPRSWRWKET